MAIAREAEPVGSLREVREAGLDREDLLGVYRNMKVPWWVDNGAGNLELVGTRLDAAGRFSQVFPMAWSPPGVYPSIVDIPAAGCWLLRLRTGKLAGVLVVRAIDARG